MPTRAGLLTAAAGVVMLVFGRIFGILELFILGVGAVGLVLLAVGWVWLYRNSLNVARSVSPPRVHVGTPSRVNLALSNTRSLPTPVLRLTDEVEGTRGAELELPPLNRNETTRAVYRLPTERRGRVKIGPLRIHVIDAFGLARRVRRDGNDLELLVYPRIDPIAAPPRPGGDDVHLADRSPSTLGRSSDEFYALREYVVGDDLRRVHWPSTARTGEMMVRQDQMPQQGRSTVLLDCRESAAHPTVFEEMVSAVASIVSACARRDDLVRLISTDGFDSGFMAGASMNDALSYLAMVAQERSGDLAAVLQSLQGSPGSVVAVIGAPNQGDQAVIDARTLSRFATTVQFGATGATPIAAAVGLRSKAIITVPPGQPFAPIWEESLPGSVRLSDTARVRAGRT